MNTMLHVCSQNNLRKLAGIVLEHGCDVNATNKKGMTPLDYCDKLNFKGMGEWLVTMGAENGHEFMPAVVPTYSARQFR